jgi:hypothetical protein
MKYLLLLLLLVACEDRYRYYCQDPKNFPAKRCQRPDCLFTQDCPDYLVAPVLEKQIERPTVSPTDTPAQNAASSTNR